MVSEKISIAIPTYFTSNFLKEVLNQFLKIEIINEILIQDDSVNFDEHKKIESIISKYNSKKIKFIKNEKNLGAFFNKIEVISNCSNDWVYQIDSDNISSNKIESLFFKILEKNDKSYIYYPSHIYQFKKYHYAAKAYSRFNKKHVVTLFENDTVLTLKKIVDIFKNGQAITKDKNIWWVLNMGNFIVNKYTLSEVVKKIESNDLNYLNADAVVFSYLWLLSHNKIMLYKDFYHYHRKRKDSLSNKQGDKTLEVLDYFQNKFIQIDL